MKLQKQVSHSVGEKTYYKHVIVIPNDVIELLGWKPGEELIVRKSSDKIVVEREAETHK